jgi:hypothetical protein
MVASRPLTAPALAAESFRAPARHDGVAERVRDAEQEIAGSPGKTLLAATSATAGGWRTTAASTSSARTGRRWSRRCRGRGNRALPPATMDRFRRMRLRGRRQDRVRQRCADGREQGEQAGCGDQECVLHAHNIRTGAPGVNGMSCKTPGTPPGLATWVCYMGLLHGFVTPAA